MHTDEGRTIPGSNGYAYEYFLKDHLGNSGTAISANNISMNIKEAYFYLFYKFYKFSEWSPSVFPNDWTATLAIDIIEMLFIASLKFYYIEYIDPSNELTPIQVILVAIVVFLLNSIIFTINDKWKPYIKEFDKLPRHQNIIGTWVVIVIVAFIMVNVAISFNAMGQIAAHRHK